MGTLSASCLEFNKKMTLNSCKIESIVFNGSYFYEGLDIENCVINGVSVFSSGGHNKNGYPIRIIGTDFIDFVDFEDCYFEGLVEIIGCNFKKGTNLTNIKEKASAVRFDVEPILKDNVGI